MQLFVRQTYIPRNLHFKKKSQVSLNVHMTFCRCMTHASLSHRFQATLQTKSEQWTLWQCDECQHLDQRGHIMSI